ncbi:(p)ppGpp synthetase [archaeon]|nr:(p)ppGpp synthetase [archaeon]|tara:strand:+ start:633 stop:1673 length:1041 start_codon:yes stop_codon:yes gene_type:complete
MKWEKSKGFSKKYVDKAGTILISRTPDQDKEESLEVLNHRREIHKYPLHIFRKRLQSSAKDIDSRSFVVGRLKRFSSIIRKLKRNPLMKLSRMQDIAGCRAVMINYKQAKKLYEEKYIKGKIKHKRIKEDDYVTFPKNDGYRSYHLVYKYKSEKKGKQDYNGLLVEIQIRSKLQHLWATAIEVVDFFTGQGLKFNKGDKEWKEFFKLVSSAFAIIENTPLVPGTPANKKELYNKIKEKEKELNLIENMNKWTDVLRIFSEQSTSKDKCFLLEIDVKQERLTITPFTREEESKAITILERLEKKNKDRKEYDIVLVRADKFEDLRKAYPNYFADTKEFLSKLKHINP